ncbi:Uncharacterized protein APZ42_012634 [Daphnia magna]|uniref:SWIM-type domain-containing protein n=1 Tax=Daphnia magna TaxID=35525 RepID=A0A162RLY2_9CRUS|nr:Uncharacterized protein APZ42_012634 [Daphnia magna]
MRLEQNVMFCGCPVRIHFRLNIFKEKFEIVKMEMEHKNHPISELHVQTYARKNYSHTLKEVLQKNRRLPEVIRRSVNLVRLHLSDRQLKQSIREVRFNTKGKHPVLKTFSDTVSPYACKLLEGEMKIVQWKAYEFVLNEELDTYSIASRHTTYSLKRYFPACTCNFFMDFGLPCRHIISCQIKNNTEIPAGSFLDHWQNECLDKLTRKPITNKDQFNFATTFFRKVADTLSQLAQSNFEEKMQLFDKIHVLIKEGKPVQLIQSVAPTEIVPPSSPVENLTDLVIDSVSSVADESHEVTSKSKTENKVLHPSWNFLHLPSAPQKRGRPRNNNGYFPSYHKQAKNAKDDVEFLDLLDEMFLREEAEHLRVGVSDMPELDHEVAMEDSFSPTSPDLVIIPVEKSQLTTRVPIRDPVIKNKWLGTGIVNLAMKILKLQHPAIGGFYCSSLGGSLEFPSATGQQWLQIVHDGANHWLLEKPRVFPCRLAIGQDPSEILSDPVKLRDHLRTCTDTEVLSQFPSNLLFPKESWVENSKHRCLLLLQKNRLRV